MGSEAAEGPDHDLEGPRIPTERIILSPAEKAELLRIRAECGHGIDRLIEVAKLTTYKRWLAQMRGGTPEGIRVNDAVKPRMIEKLRNLCDGAFNNKTIAVLGVTFKPNTDDMRDAPSLTIVPALLGGGAKVRLSSTASSPGMLWSQPWGAALLSGGRRLCDPSDLSAAGRGGLFLRHPFDRNPGGNRTKEAHQNKGGHPAQFSYKALRYILTRWLFWCTHFRAKKLKKSLLGHRGKCLFQH